jgi:ribosomal protein S6
MPFPTNQHKKPNINCTDFKALTAIMKEVSLKVVENGGIVRSVQNHGLRTFPQRFKAKYPDILTQQRYYEQGRFISFYYDANPSTLKQIEAILNMNDQVLRHTHLKSRSKVDWINHKNEKNPYAQEVLRRDRELLELQRAEDATIRAGQEQMIDAVLDSVVDTAQDDTDV